MMTTKKFTMVRRGACLLPLLMTIGCVSLPINSSKTPANSASSTADEMLKTPLPPAAQPGETSQLSNAETTSNDAMIPKITHLRWPIVGGRISSGFGRRHGSFHKGIDIVAPKGTPVYASAGGEVVFAARTKTGYGRMVIIKHTTESTVYAHLSKMLVKSGQLVAQSEKIGLVGSTGRTTGPHLHFEVRSSEDGEPMDPTLFLPHYDLISALDLDLDL